MLACRAFAHEESGSYTVAEAVGPRPTAAVRAHTRVRARYGSHGNWSRRTGTERRPGESAGSGPRIADCELAKRPRLATVTHVRGDGRMRG
jgi:hypothetical protein